MAVSSTITQRRGPRGVLGHLVAAGEGRQIRGPRRGLQVRFPTFGCTLLTDGRGRYRDAAHDEAIGPGSLVLVFPEHPHWYGAVSRWDERFLVFDGPIFRAAAGTGLLDVRHPVHHLGEVDRWAARFDQFRWRRPPTCPAESDAEAAMVLALLAEMVGSRAGLAAADEPGWLDRSIELLGADPAEPVAPAAVAAAVGMPYETWRRAFRQATGVAPARFRLDHRLALAADHLTTTSRSVRSIAADLGFTDEQHLSARFRERYGCTPAAYRRPLAAPTSEAAQRS